MSKTVGVMLTLPFSDVFDYKASDDVKIGDIVRVPFGRSFEIGVVFHVGDIDLWIIFIQRITHLAKYCINIKLFWGNWGR